ncbi:cytochrome P450 [Williamsia sp.]|uniref:cytochrome P450 n=1 Tax=Williamsia sp. TaxID=1872085 RepID=UPI001A336AC5|nr:cytochrome P450 [Williamsia sp.]MBJ7290417.1 cytochrome P450 [Williamsia sp.]
MSTRTIRATGENPVLPPGTAMPGLLQGVSALRDRRAALMRLRDRFGPDFTIKLPTFGTVVVISEPDEVRQIFKTRPEDLDQIEANLGRVLGPNSLFALEGRRHKDQRKLLVPPFHGRRLAGYESVMVDEASREFASWPQGREMSVLDSMMSITLNIILRAVFGAQGSEFERLRVVIPPMVELGSKLIVVPVPTWDLGRFSPWGRLNRYRREYDAIVDGLIATAVADPGLADRGDVLAMMVQSRYDDGSAMTNAEISDQLLTLLTAGHETTATTLAWAIERLRRHPAILDRLVAEVDAGVDDLLTAVILEVQRTRPVIDSTFRQVKASSYSVGPWVLPRGQNIMVGIDLVHTDDAVFADAARFDPDRFLGARPDPHEWIPFGGGVRRCIGAAFATMELHTVLRTLLTDYSIEPTLAPDESWYSRGVAFAPGSGGRIVVRRRSRRDVPTGGPS